MAGGYTSGPMAPSSRMNPRSFPNSVEALENEITERVKKMGLTPEVRELLEKTNELRSELEKKNLCVICKKKAKLNRFNFHKIF